MTATDRTPLDHGQRADSASVAESLSVVGYALFAVLRHEPLRKMSASEVPYPSLDTGLDHVEPVPAPEDEASEFGEPEVDEAMAAIQRDDVVAVPPTFVEMPDDDEPFVPPPLPVAQSGPQNSLTILKTISFLDE